jgi:LmbE family N-acetylglucosaminyl deacetylase
MVLKAKSRPTTKRRQPESWSKKLSSIIETSHFAKVYMALAVVILFGTTIFWSLLSARIQASNADQLINTDLFKNSATFRNATFPSIHSSLLKWPIFWLIKLFGATSLDFTIFTIAIVIVTVAALLAIIYKIERRPLVFGTICLALASVLLLVPAQPYAGDILPVNMAMLATRNLEYVVYILSLIIIIRLPRLKSWGFWLAVACLSLLIASDKLFLVFSIGGALIALIVYGSYRAWKFVTNSIDWLSLGIIASVIAIIILALINASHITHLSNQSSIGPYNMSSKASNLVLGSLYAVLGLFTNFGANPAFDSTVVRNIPHALLVRLTSLGGPAYVINAAILIFGLYVVIHLLHKSWKHKQGKKVLTDKASILSIMLIWTTIIALVSFIVTDHHYAVDARYLTISLFAIFISVAVYVRGKHWRSDFMVVAGGLLIVSIILGLFSASRTYTAEKNALASQNQHNFTIAQVLTRHPVDVLVGNYWRVVPTNLLAHNKLNILPLSSCTVPLQILSSTTWQPNLYKHSFAYLLTLNGDMTNYPNCTLKQVVNYYGRPNTSVLIAGTLSQPKELLLYYDNGIHKGTSKNPQVAQGPATVLPISLSQLPNTTSCTTLSVMNIVAHEDDDLLFMNPDLIHEIQAGYCIHSIYLTAGDAGIGQFYWLSREQGSEAAYDYMLGISSNTVWVQRIVELNSHEFIAVANPKGNSTVSLIFMHLPDGNLSGQGFSFSGYESLAKLYSGSISVINSVDNQSYYSSAQLTAALSTLMTAYRATEINTQSDFVSTQDPDHSDHMTVSLFVKQAYQQYETQQYANSVVIPINFYIGYPITQRSENVTGTDLQEKEATFLAYAKYDGRSCQTLQSCLQNGNYGVYFTREYRNSY